MYYYKNLIYQMHNTLRNLFFFKFCVHISFRAFFGFLCEYFHIVAFLRDVFGLAENP